MTLHFARSLERCCRCEKMPETGGHREVRHQGDSLGEMGCEQGREVSGAESVQAGKVGKSQVSQAGTTMLLTSGPRGSFRRTPEPRLLQLAPSEHSFRGRQPPSDPRERWACLWKAGCTVMPRVTRRGCRVQSCAACGAALCPARGEPPASLVPADGRVGGLDGSSLSPATADIIAQRQFF